MREAILAIVARLLEKRTKAQASAGEAEWSEIGWIESEFEPPKLVGEQKIDYWLPTKTQEILIGDAAALIRVGRINAYPLESGRIRVQEYLEVPSSRADEGRGLLAGLVWGDDYDIHFST